MKRLCIRQEPNAFSVSPSKRRADNKIWAGPSGSCPDFDAYISAYLFMPFHCRHKKGQFYFVKEGVFLLWVTHHKNYAGTIQLTGQTSTHCGVGECPSHSMQVAALITYTMPSPSLMELVGHSGRHTPQAMQSSKIFRAIRYLRGIDTTFDTLLILLQ